MLYGKHITLMNQKITLMKQKITLLNQKITLMNQKIEDSYVCFVYRIHQYTPFDF
jgi:hypothetical protein